MTELELAKPPGKAPCNSVVTIIVWFVYSVGSHQATLKELSRVRHELLKVKSLQPRESPKDAGSKNQEPMPQVCKML